MPARFSPGSPRSPTGRPSLFSSTRRPPTRVSLFLRSLFIATIFLSTFFPIVYFYQISIFQQKLGLIPTQASADSEQRQPLKDQSPSKFAYVFLIGGIHEDRPAYLGFLFNVLVAQDILRSTGSHNDVWVLLQFAADANITELPPKQLQILQESGLRYRILPKIRSNTFSELVYEKFRVLEMTQYTRVMFLDADVIPLANLDYLFDTTMFRPNLIVATRGEPCNAGLFILEPKNNSWEELQQIILQQHESAKNLPYPKFDRQVGWGHSFLEAGDEWTAIEKTGKRWHYHASHSDQGLLYYFAKYHVQDVSIIIGDRVEHWVSYDTAKRHNANINSSPIIRDNLPVRIGTTTQDEIRKLTTIHPLAYQSNCNTKPKSSFLCHVPYRDYAHFYGRTKPWQASPSTLVYYWSQTTSAKNINSTNASEMKAPTLLWFQTLKKINGQIGLGITEEFWQTQSLRESPLGYMAMWKDHHQRVEGFHNNTKTTKR